MKRIISLLLAIIMAITVFPLNLFADEVESNIQGDFNNDGIVDRLDAIYLLYFTIFGPEDYYIGQFCDYSTDGNITRDDAVYLLYHTIYGEEEYPLGGGDISSSDWIINNGWEYMYNALHKNSYRQILSEIVAGIRSYETNIRVSQLLTVDESKAFANFFLPLISVEYTYVDSISYTTNNGRFAGVRVSYYVESAEDGDRMVSELQNATDNVLRGMKSSWSDYEKVLYLHDWLVKKCTPDTNSYGDNRAEWCKTMWPNTAYGAIVDGRPNVLGYAKGMLYLLSRAGFEVSFAEGIGLSSLHLWIKVKVDGKWYNIDPTWDDPYGAAQTTDPNYVRYDYFMVTDEYIKDTRSEVYEILFFDDPECTDTTYDWYVYNNCYATSYDEAVEILNEQARRAAESGGDIEYVSIKLASDSLYDEVRIAWGSAKFVDNILSNYTTEYLNVARSSNSSGRTLTYRLYK